MNPIDILCEKCGTIFPCGHSCPSNECNEGSTLFLDEVVKERKPHDESDEKSTNIESDFATYAIDEFQVLSLDQNEGECHSSHLRSSNRDPLISEGNPPSSPAIEENFMEGNQEDIPEVTGALGDSFANDSEFLTIFEHLITDDSSVPDEGKDKIDKTIDSCEKQSESSQDDIAKAIRDPKCQRISPGGRSCPSNECNEDSTLFLDEVVKERKPHDESDEKSTNIESDFTTYAIDEFQVVSLDQNEGEWDSSHLRSSNRDPLISEGNPPSSPAIEENFMEGNQEDIPEVTGALGDSFANDSEFLNIFEHLVTDDSSVSEQGKNKTIDSCESSQPDIAKAIRDFRIETTSGDYCGGEDLSLLQESDDLQSTFEGSSPALPSCSHAGPSTTDHSGYCKSKSKKSPLNHSPKRNFPSGICGLKLPTARSYKRHQVVHTGEKAFDCKDCGQIFSRKYNLKIHNRRHSGELPLPCMVRIQTGEQPLVCLTCGRVFTYSSNLYQHRRRRTH